MNRLWVCALLLAACPGDAVNENDVVQGVQSVSYDEALKAGRLEVYEGLPHPAFERELLEQEKKKRHTMLHGFPFYASKPPWGDGDSELRGLLATERFTPWSGEKKCGGFHPDYAVVVTHGAMSWTVLVCFGCSEVKVVGHDERRFDVSTSLVVELQNALSLYGGSRPERE